ncbi:ABC transporter permease [Synergistales bacterium]|nr:ABC transporter permease [Synergistales bacterium]
MVFEPSYILVSLQVGARYIDVTLSLSLIPLLIGLIIGTPIAICRRSRSSLPARFFSILIPVMKGIPLVLYVLALNFIILKPLDMLARYYAWADSLRFMDKAYIGLAAMSLYAIATVSETMRSAFASVADGQYEACRSVGMTEFQALRRVIMPQALAYAVPVLCNNLIGLIKGSSIVFVISALDVMNGALSSAQINYRFLEAYIAAALIYWALCLVVESLSTILERRFKRHMGRA